MQDMESNEENVRRPLQTPYMRRDTDHNPEYLDAERALVRFTPLIDSIVRRLRPWYGRYGNEQDAEDLHSLVQTEFLLLHSRYDPSYGVDFPGYIKMNLERRVRYYVNRNWRRQSNEVLAFASEVTDNYMESVRDTKADGAIDRVNRVASVSFDHLDDDMYRDIIKKVLVDGVNLYELAEQYNMSPRSMALRIDAAGRYARAAEMEQNNGEEEQQQD